MDGQDPWWWRPATDDYHDDMLFDFSSDSDPLELALGDEGEAVAAGQPVVPCDRSPPPQVTPPSEDMMAAWLYPIVSGEDHVSDDLKSLMAEETIRPAVVATTGDFETMTTISSKGKLPTTQGMSSKAIYEHDTNTMSRICETRKKAAAGLGGSSSLSSRRTRSSNYSGTHNTTEKRRRCKIAERLKTLQQLVPGCDKSNQASTLEQTIQYMKSLQQHLVRGMNMRPPPQAGAAAAAVYPVVMPPAMAAAAVAVPMPPASAVVATAGMVPYGGLAPAPMLPYHAMVMHAAAAPFYPPAAQAAASAAPPDAAGGQCSVAMEQQQKEEKGSYTTGSSAGYIS